MKRFILVVPFLFVLNSYGATFSCDVTSCTNPMANCPDNIYVLEGTEKIVFNFFNAESSEIPQEIHYPGLSYAYSDDKQYMKLTDESDLLFEGTKEEDSNVYTGVFETYETLNSTIENMPVVTAKVRCNRVN